MSFVEVMTDVFAPMFGFFNSLLGSIFLFGLMLILLMLSLLLLGRSRRKRAQAASAGPIEPTIAPASETTPETTPESASESASELAGEQGSASADAVVISASAPEAVDANAATQEDDTATASSVQPAKANGFSFFKRKKTKTAAAPESGTPESVSPDVGAAGGTPAMPSFEDAEGEGTERNEMLSQVEQEMLATRQLYLNGHISKDVYIAETRTLYERAQRSE